MTERAGGLTVLIVDDEHLARERLRDLLSARPEVDAVLAAESGAAAIAQIREHEPDVVFLDMQMPGMSGMQVVKTIGPAAMPVTIFVTAYDEYAIQAFEVSALDYLLKPFEDERFRQAFRRAVRHVELTEVESATQRLVSLLDGGPVPAGTVRAGAPAGRIAVETNGVVHVVPLDAVTHVTAAGPYAELHTSERTHVLRETMSNLEARLESEGFVRIHRSTLVRLDRIETLERGESGNCTLRLKGGTELSVSRARVRTLEQRLGLAS